MDTFRTPTIGLLLMGGLIAGVLAYTFSSRRAIRQPTTQEMLLERAREFGETEAARVGREFVSDRVIPEMKPVLLDLLKDAETRVDHYFRKAEKTIKSM